MTRYLYGGIADYVLIADDVDGDGLRPVRLKPGAVLRFYDAPDGDPAEEHTDLLDYSGDPITPGELVADANGAMPLTYSPDEVLIMYMSADGGPRRAIFPLNALSSLNSKVNGLVFDEQWITDMQALLATGTTGQYLGRDPNPASVTGLQWAAPPASGGASGTMWVDASAGAYSADKTGGIDARAAIQAAIDDVSAGGGGVVWLPRGTYKIGYTSNAGGTGAAGGLQLKTNVWLRGDGIATRLEATGTWSSDAGIVGIGDAVVSQAVRDTRVSDLWIKGTAGTSHTEPGQYIHGILYNTAGITVEPDAAHKIHDVTIWDCDRGIALVGDDDQAMTVQRIRGRWFRRQGILVGREGGSGGGPDNLFAQIDVSSANHMLGTYAGVEVYTSNSHFVQCKSWFNRRGSAFAESGTYHDGAGWYVANVRNYFVSCEAQDNGGHGWIDRYGKNVYAGCVADSNNNSQCISGAAGPNECSGFYWGSAVGEVSAIGCASFDRNATASLRYQRAGYSLDAAARNIELEGVAYDNRSTGAAADPADGVKWVNGSAHSSHEVRVLSAYGTTRITIANTGTGGGVVQKRQDSGAAVVTGTVLTGVPALTASVPGGRWYRLEAWLMYRADAATNARVGLAVTRDTASGYAELDWQATYVKPDGSTATEFSLSLIGTTRYVVADGDGGVAGAGYTNQRSIHIVGQLYVGTTVNVATVAVQVAENGGTGTGVKVIENSYLTLTPANYS